MKPTVPKPIALVAAVACLAILQGCASWFDQPEPEPEPKPEPKYPERSLNYGVSYETPVSDVAHIESGYEHAVLPEGRKPIYREGWKERSLAAADASELGSETETLNETSESSPKSQTEETVTKPDPLDSLKGKSKRIYLAWKKLCENRLEDMDEADYSLIRRHSMPEELTATCSEREALGRLK